MVQVVGFGFGGMAWVAGFLWLGGYNFDARGEYAVAAYVMMSLVGVVCACAAPFFTPDRKQ
ncbi:hypothetical protein ELG77_08905 [Rhizobium leguminosarum]|uniref:hypothetical protein n=1 Tax=Rhizobium leguminosarum TaxID=384 RepID=UPI0010306163|nr:hypothetical protein [Rhizobium leguminosarum]TBG37140.1 hypothetical protein ELG78_09175 [Rhizobium leguminosarum]TBG41880.1 hypothetical protein ELG77_08905 [Rhizobium leguminosarum]